MIKYRLTKKGKIVIAALCTFVILFTTLGITLTQDKTPSYYDYNEPADQNQQQASTPPPVPVPPAKEEPWEQLKVTIYFDANMSSFDKDYQKALNIFTDTALQHQLIEIKVEGNCATLFPKNQSDKQKSANYNLSLLRAQTVANYLKDKGVKAERIVVVANGSDKPVKDNNSPEGRRLNRRVDVFFIKK